MAASPLFLGRINLPSTVASQAVQVSSALATLLGLNAQQRRLFGYHALLLSPAYNNTGRVFIGGEGINPATGVAMTHTLGIPSSGSISSFGVANVLAPAGIDISAWYLLPESANDGVYATLLVT